MVTLRLVVESVRPVIREFDDFSDMLEFIESQLHWGDRALYDYAIYDCYADMPFELQAQVLLSGSLRATIDV